VACYKQTDDECCYKQVTGRLFVSQAIDAERKKGLGEQLDIEEQTVSHCTAIHVVRPSVCQSGYVTFLTDVNTATTAPSFTTSLSAR